MAAPALLVQDCLPASDMFKIKEVGGGKGKKVCVVMRDV